MRFLADEGVDKPIVMHLRAAGFDVHYILETYQGAEDEKVLLIAAKEKRILITQDKDFGELVYPLKNCKISFLIFAKLQAVLSSLLS